MLAAPISRTLVLHGQRWREIPQGVASQGCYKVVVLVVESSRDHCCLQDRVMLENEGGLVGASITAPDTLPPQELRVLVA